VIRPIRPDDKGMLSDGLRRLSLQSVQRRFLTPKRSFSRAELRYLTEVDGRDHVALVAENPCADPSRRLIAVARFVRTGAEPDTAEIAVTVGDAWQGRGLGSVLGTHLAHLARNRGIWTFTATMASENTPAHKLMAKLTNELRQQHVGGGVDELTLDLAA
jgi:GNAT superfamily N-acetyltransferase